MWSRRPVRIRKFGARRHQRRLLRGKTTYSAASLKASNPLQRKNQLPLGQPEHVWRLTTVSMSYTRGWTLSQDAAWHRRSGVPSRADRQTGYRRNAVLTRNLLASLNFETDESEGYLQNPYREARYFTGSGNGYSFEPQFYPHTHTAMPLRWSSSTTCPGAPR